MGSDIHLFAEYETRKDGLVAISDGEFCVPRSYPLFAALAGVRGAGRSPLIEPRGVPTELSAGVFMNYFRPIVADGRQAIWRDFKYVLESDARRGVEDGTLQRFSQQPATSSVQSNLGYVVDSDVHSASFLSLQETKDALAHHSLAIRDTPIQFQILLSVLQQVEDRIEGAKARLVFWFFS